MTRNLIGGKSPVGWVISLLLRLLKARNQLALRILFKNRISSGYGGQTGKSCGFGLNWKAALAECVAV